MLIHQILLKADLASLKSDAGQLYIGKLKTVPVDLSMLSNIVNNDVAKKAEFDKVVTKVNTIDTNEFVLKTQYNSDKSGFQKKIDDAFKKIPDASGFGKKKHYSTKITEIEGKISSITGLATTTALNAVVNEIPDVSNLVKKRIKMQKYQKLNLNKFINK